MLDVIDCIKEYVGENKARYELMHLVNTLGLNVQDLQEAIAVVKQQPTSSEIVEALTQANGTDDWSSLHRRIIQYVKGVGFIKLAEGIKVQFNPTTFKLVRWGNKTNGSFHTNYYKVKCDLSITLLGEQVNKIIIWECRNLKLANNPKEFLKQYAEYALGDIRTPLMRAVNRHSRVDEKFATTLYNIVKKYNIAFAYKEQAGIVIHWSDTARLVLVKQGEEFVKDKATHPIFERSLVLKRVGPQQ